MKLTNSIVSLFLGILTATSALFAQPEATAKTKLKLALNWVPEPEFGGFYAAELEGFFAKEGLDVEIIVGGAGSPTAQMLAAGKVDLAVTSGNEIVIARDRGAKIKAIFSVYEKSPFGLMVRKDRKMKSLDEVFADKTKGVTLAIEKGQAFFDLLKEKYDLSSKKVVPYTGGVTQFLRDPLFIQQGFVFSEPITAENAGVPADFFLLADIGYNPYMEVLSARDESLQKDSAKMAAVVRAVRAGWVSYLKDPRRANEKMSALNKAMDLATFKKAADAQASLVQEKTGDRKKLGKMKDERWLEMAELLKKIKVIKKILSASDYYVDLE